MVFDVITKRHDNHPRAKLRNAVITCVKEPPMRFVAELLELALYEPAIIFKDCRQEAANILDHDGLGPGLIYKSNRGWEKIALILVAKLLAGNGEWRAWQASCQQVNSFVANSIKQAEVFLMNGPIGPIQAQGLATIAIDLDNASMIEACKF
ncbi:hypothetical protein LL06_20905 [Hoeflea sp. BAL378]|nr:hypothetical protein LL06_20905 [Hoeflea sp. BAL378]